MKLKSNHIVLLDPGLQDNNNTPSFNLGDLIISESNIEVLQSLFPEKEIIRISSHSFLSTRDRNIVNSALFSFLGGTNLLHSDMLTERIFLMRKGRLLWLFPGINNLILLGVGWGLGYKENLTLRTKILYKNILHPGYIHSVRDGYTHRKLQAATKRSTLNTACSSMWRLDKINSNLNIVPKKCLLTLTDYKQDRKNDGELIQFLLSRFSKITYFPQGSKDLEYLFSLDIFNKNKSVFELLPHSYTAFKEYLKKEEFVYIGTRLHAGIKCIEKGKKSLIISIDHRSSEIAADTFIPVIKRGEYDSIDKWIEGKEVFTKPIFIPLEEIKNWKSQFI